MSSDDHVEIRFPKKLTTIQIGIIAFFIVFMYFVVELTKFALDKQNQNPNIVVIILLMVIVLIGMIALYVIHQLSRSEKD